MGANQSSASILNAAPGPTEPGLVVRGAGVFATTSGAGASTSAVTRVAANAANVTLLAANTARRGASIINNSATQTLFFKYGATANIGAGTESFTGALPPGVNAYHEVFGGYVGQIDGIWSGADAAGEALMTELS